MTKPSAKTKRESHYQKMTVEERAEFNRICERNRKARLASDPQKKAAHALRIREWKRSNKEKHAKHNRDSLRKRRASNPEFRAVSNLRNRFKDLMSNTRNGGNEKFSSLIGCSTKELAKHLESKFTKGMAWQNYGTYWHVDHIIPCASFDHTNPKQRAACWHWTNLQPMEAKANLTKSNKITEPQMQLPLCVTH